MENAEQSIYNIRQGRESNGPAKVSEVIVNDVYTKLAQITGDDKEKYKGIPSGFGMLDKMLTGLNKGNLILIGAVLLWVKQALHSILLKISQWAQEKSV